MRHWFKARFSQPRNLVSGSRKTQDPERSALLANRLCSAPKIADRLADRQGQALRLSVIGHGAAELLDDGVLDQLAAEPLLRWRFCSPGAAAIGPAQDEPVPRPPPDDRDLPGPGRQRPSWTASVVSSCRTSARGCSPRARRRRRAVPVVGNLPARRRPLPRAGARSSAPARPGVEHPALGRDTRPRRRPARPGDGRAGP